MMRQLVCIICIIVLIRINEGTSQSDCMVTITGPTQNVSQRPEEVEHLVVNELEPAEFYCEFIRHDSDETKYIYLVYIDTIYPSDSIRPKRERISLNQQEPHPPKGTNIINTNIASSTNNVSIYKTQMMFLSVNSDTPIVLATCAIEYGHLSSANKTSCFHSSRFAIIPNNTESDTITCPTNPIVTTGPVNSMTPSIDTIVSKSEFGSTVGVLCSIVMAETALIIIFIIYQFVKNKKSRRSRIDVVPMHATNACMCS